MESSFTLVNKYEQIIKELQNRIRELEEQIPKREPVKMINDYTKEEDPYP